MGSNATSEGLSGKYIYILIAVLLVWGMTFYSDIFSAARIWYISEIFHHGFFVVPLACYLAWSDRYKLNSLSVNNIRPNYWLILPLFIVLFVGVFSHVGKIAVLGHIAAFSSLSLIIWLIAGNKVAKAFYFPLGFVLFSIPIGEELIPFLQTITADFAVLMLKGIGIPIFRNGLYIEIPEGRFVVAEACSGISFLIVSIVFGTVFSYMGFRKRSKQIAFVIISVVFPILANGLRVFGIVAVGHYSNMEHATGADHIIYGGVFFSFVLVCLYLIGVKMGGDLRANVIHAPEGSTLDIDKLCTPSMYQASIIVLAVLVFFNAWKYVIAGDKEGEVAKGTLEFEQFTPELIGPWVPSFDNAAYRYRGRFFESGNDKNSGDIFVAWFTKTSENSELIARANRFYRQDRWSHDWKKTARLEINGKSIPVALLKVYSPESKPRYIVYWYITPLYEGNSNVKTKLLQTMDMILGGDGKGGVVAFSMDGIGDEQTKSDLLPFAKNAYLNMEGELRDMGLID